METMTLEATVEETLPGFEALLPYGFPPRVPLRVLGFVVVDREVRAVCARPGRTLHTVRLDDLHLPEED